MGDIVSLLQKYQFSEIEITKILEKKPKKDFDLENTNLILGTLKEYDVLSKQKIRNKIAKILKVCQYNNLIAIEEILESKGYDVKEILSRAGSILFKANKQKLEEVIEVLENTNLDVEMIITKCSNLFKNASVNKIKSIIYLLQDNGIDVRLIEKCTSVLVGNSASEMYEVMAVLKEYFPFNYKNIILECPVILSRAKASEIRGIKEELDADFEFIMNLCPSILAFSSASEIKKIKQELNEQYKS